MEKKIMNGLLKVGKRNNIIGFTMSKQFSQFLELDVGDSVFVEALLDINTLNPKLIVTKYDKQIEQNNIIKPQEKIKTNEIKTNEIEDSEVEDSEELYNKWTEKASLKAKELYDKNIITEDDILKELPKTYKKVIAGLDIVQYIIDDINDLKQNDYNNKLLSIELKKLNNDLLNNDTLLTHQYMMCYEQFKNNNHKGNFDEIYKLPKEKLYKKYQITIPSFDEIQQVLINNKNKELEKNGKNHSYILINGFAELKK
jgi:hypothetical protein